MNEKKDLIQNWLSKAEHDLLAAKKLVLQDEELTDIICFHCQQAAEKYLKGYMIYLDLEFKKTHEIGEIITIIETADNAIASLKESADTLTDYAVEIRYPEDYLMPTPNETHEAIRIAEEIKQYVVQNIKL